MGHLVSYSIPYLHSEIINTVLNKNNKKKKTKKKQRIEKTSLFPLLMYKSARGQKWVDKDEKETESYSFFFQRFLFNKKKKKNTKKCRRFLCVFGARLLPPPSIRIASVAGLTVAAVLTEISREKARVQNVSFGGSPRELSTQK